MDEAEIEKVAALEQRHWWYAGRRAVIRRLLRDTRPGRAADVGAGGGGNAALLRDLGWRTVAADTSIAATLSCHARGLATVRADGTRLPFADASLDLLISADTWEHVEDDTAMAAEAARVLRPGGVLIVAVPSGMDLWSGHDVALGHVRRYERSELVRLITGAGFTIHRVHAWNVLLRPVAKLRRRNNTGESDMEHVNPMVNLGLRVVVGLEALLPVSRRRGISLFVLAHRGPER